MRAEIDNNATLPAPISFNIAGAKPLRIFVIYTRAQSLLQHARIFEIELRYIRRFLARSFGRLCFEQANFTIFAFET